MTTTKSPNVDESYLAAFARALALLSTIQEKLQDMPAPEDGDSIHWGHVGSLNHIVGLLDQANEHLS